MENFPLCGISSQGQEESEIVRGYEIQLNAPEMLFRCKYHFWISLEEESLIESKMSANST